MIDKKNDQFDDLDNKKNDRFEFADDFSDDFDDEDPFKEKTKKDTVMSNDYDLELESESDPIPVQTTPTLMEQVVDFAKGYGLPILLVGGLGYFGLKYSLGAMFGSEEKTTTTTQTVHFNDKNSSVNKLVGLPAPGNKPAIEKTEVNQPKQDPTTINEPATIKPIAKDPVPNLEPVTPAIVAKSEPIELKPVVTPPPSSAPVSEPVAVVGSLPVNANSDIMKLQNEVKSINAQLDAKLGENTAAVSQIKQQMQQLSVYVQGIGKAMTILSTTVKRQEDILTTLVDSTVGKSVSKKSTAKGLVLEALIPGRAWFRAKSGEEITVGVGDMLPGYGKVIKIDSKQGTVTTNNGTVLTQ